jgi:hypothetical protein
MASVVWSGLFLFLVFELAIVAILVLPWPSRVRRYIAAKVHLLKLGPRLRVVAQWILLALFAAIAESINTLTRFHIREEQPADSGENAMDAQAGYIEVSMEKQRMFRAERNLYLAGFALTLLVVIKRIVELMEFSHNLEMDREFQNKRLNDIAGVADHPSSNLGSSGVSNSNSSGSKRSTVTSKAD